ncbi:MAG TPA: C25 family cysteine peptidase, partial [Pyrinomonadaceae bacterium]
TAAGLSPAADPARLRLYAGGVEVPLRCDPAAWREPGGGLEFYGEALDLPSADTRVYWLVEGDEGGPRTDAPRAPSGPVSWVGVPRVRVEPDKSGVGLVPGPPPPASQQGFAYTAERRERSVYFSSLQNGEAENFFGGVVGANGSAQTLTARNGLKSDAPTTRLEVALQGVSTGPHRVSVLFNGSPLGVIDFAGQANRAAAFAVPSRLLREGDNEVRLVAGGAGDVSLTDRLRLTYQHALRADDDRLRFYAVAGAVRVGGFSTPAARVLDVTDPGSPSELRVRAAEPDPRGGWGVTFEATGKGRRELYAFTGACVLRPASVAANAPSRWSLDAGQRADLVVITHEDFARQVAPLAALRESEGMEVAVVDVEDLFDEFSYGAHTPQAVRDFLAWTRASWDKPPSYVLLVGDGSYDPRGRLGRGRHDLVPSKLLDAGSMETASDDWFADFDDDGVPEMAVGRLPVRTQAEAAAVVGKIVSRGAGPSETSALLVADRDGAEGYSFEAATDAVRAMLPAQASVARVNRRAQDAAAVRGQIVSGINAGPLVVNWMGHGSVDVWTGEGLLRGADAA